MQRQADRRAKWVEMTNNLEDYMVYAELIEKQFQMAELLRIAKERGLLGPMARKTVEAAQPLHMQAQRVLKQEERQAEPAAAGKALVVKEEKPNPWHKEGKHKKKDWW